MGIHWARRRRGKADGGLLTKTTGTIAYLCLPLRRRRYRLTSPCRGARWKTSLMKPGSSGLPGTAQLVGGGWLELLAADLRATNRSGLLTDFLDHVIFAKEGMRGTVTTQLPSQKGVWLWD